MEWNTVTSTVRPSDTDTKSSKVYNYIRKNIEEIQTEDGAMYRYEEAKIRKEDWGFFTEQAQQRADIDYLLMVTEEL
ncbi:MAG: hypothetical protein J6S60_05990 [Oscillospiraceae bacterium]|nr:hypothetical protein [Oscillospiraceae bacterium]